MRAAKLSLTAPAWTPITIYKTAGLRANLRNGEIYFKKPTRKRTEVSKEQPRGSKCGAITPPQQTPVPHQKDEPFIC